jgi:hypothetical protein
LYFDSPLNGGALHALQRSAICRSVATCRHISGVGTTALRNRNLHSAIRNRIDGLSECTMISPKKNMARIRVPAGRWAGRRRRFDGARFESCGSVAENEPGGVRQSHERSIFPVIGRGRHGDDRRQPGTEDEAIQARRPVRKERKSEQASRANPYKPALLVLKHEARPLSGAAHWGRSR